MDDTSFLALALRLVLSLGVVLALLLGAAAVVKRKGLGPGRGRSGALEVLARQPLGRSASLAVVRVGERALVLGVTEQSVTLIDEADGSLFAPGGGSGAGTGTGGSGATRTALPGDGGVDPVRTGRTGTALMDALRDRTVRRS